jgi:lycopene beta-cyclase
VVAIGSGAGMLKASTGYAFGRIQRDSAALADSLSLTGIPARPAERQRFRRLDRIFLRAVASDPSLLERTFAALVDDHGGVASLLRFLDEDSSLWQDARLVRRMPAVPFLRSALQPHRH